MSENIERAPDEGGSSLAALSPTQSGIDRRTLLRRGGAMGAALSTAGVVAACGGGTSKASTASTTAQTATSTNGGQTSSATGTISSRYKGKTIGVVEYTPTDQNEAVIVTEMKAASKAAGLNWNIKSVGAQGEPTLAATAIENFISEKVDAIMMIVVPASAVGPQLARAASAGIPVFGNYSFGQDVPGVTADYSALLPMDASALGLYIAYSWLAQKPKGPIRIAMLDNTDVPLLDQRSVVFKSLLTLFPQFQVVASHNVNLANLVSDTSSATGAILSSHPALDIVWTNYAPVALAAASAVSAAGRHDVTVYGHVSGVAALDAIRSGTSPLKAISWVDFIYNAWGFVDLMLHHFGGQSVTPLISEITPIPVVVIDKDHNLPPAGQNYESFGGSFKRTFINSWKTEFAG